MSRSAGGMSATKPIDEAVVWTAGEVAGSGESKLFVPAHIFLRVQAERDKLADALSGMQTRAEALLEATSTNRLDVARQRLSGFIADVEREMS
jgi:hypothetical protein